MSENAHREVPLSAIFRTRHGRVYRDEPSAFEEGVIPEATPAPLSDEQLFAEEYEHPPEEDGLFSDFDSTVDMVQQEDEFQLDDLVEEAEARAAEEAEAVALAAEVSAEVAIAHTPPPPPPPPPPKPKDPDEQLDALLPEDLDPLWISARIHAVAERRAKSRKDPKRPWFKDLFRKEYVFAHPVRSQAVTKMEVRFIEERLKVAEGARVLDLACGYGRHTTPLARRGYEMVGIDLSLDLLKIGVKQAEKEGLEIQFVHGDMRELNFDKVFDGAFCLGTSFGYFSDAQNFMILSNIYKGLKKGGRFILEVVNRDHAIRELPKRGWWEGKGCLVQEDVEFDHIKSQARIKRYLVFSDGGERVYDVRIRLYAYHELCRMLEMLGFEVLNVTGSFHTPGVFFGPSSESLIITARKKG